MLKKREYGRIGETVFTDTLENGLKLIVIPKPGYKKSLAFLAVSYGGADRQFRVDGQRVKTPSGIAHFLEHKMFDMPSGENALTLLSGRGASANAFTASDMTAYHFECYDRFDENLETLLSFVSTPYFTPESVEKERGIIAQEIKMGEDEPDQALYYGLLRNLFKRNPLREPIVGTVESIGEITADTLTACHGLFYTPANMALVVVANQDPIRVRDMAERILPRERREAPRRDYGDRDGLKPVRARRETVMDVGAPLFLAGLKTGPRRTGEEGVLFELTAALALNALMSEASPLYGDLYAKGLINETFSYDFEASAGVSFLSFGGETQEPDAVMEAVMAEAARVAREGFDEAYFARRKKAALGDELRALGSFDNIAYNYAVGAFAGYDYYSAMPLMAGLTREDVMAFLDAWFRPEHLAVSLVRGGREGA